MSIMLAFAWDLSAGGEQNPEKGHVTWCGRVKGWAAVGGFTLNERRSDRHVHALQYIGRMGSCKDGNCLSACL